MFLLVVLRLLVVLSLLLVVLLSVVVGSQLPLLYLLYIAYPFIYD